MAGQQAFVNGMRAVAKADPVMKSIIERIGPLKLPEARERLGPDISGSRVGPAFCTVRMYTSRSSPAVNRLGISRKSGRRQGGGAPSWGTNRMTRAQLS